MNDIQAQQFANEITDSVYYKKLQSELRAKKNKAATLNQTDPSHDQAVAEQTANIDGPNNKKKFKKPPSFNPEHFKDKLLLNSTELKKTLDTDKPKQELREKKLLEKLKYNGHEIMRHLSHQINFSARQDEFKEMYRYNMQQAQSHNLFTSRFAKFKVGVVGHILAALGIPIAELKKLKQTALNELFNDNIAEMTELIYNMELAETLHGRSRKARGKLKLFSKLQQQLISQMNNVGRVGYWSKRKLYETKIEQCKKIKQEFVDEHQHLNYMLTFIDQTQGAA